MIFKIAINGYGRIGQSVLRAIYASPLQAKFRIVAINELTDIETLTYQTRYDTTHGRFPHPLSHDGRHLIIGDDRIRVYNEVDPARIPWEKTAVDLVFECSGSCSDRKTAEQHLKSGARRLLLSYPAATVADAIIIFGYNDRDLKKSQRVVSAGSCTTNCLLPILAILERNFSIVNGVTTTIHSAMNDQPITDSYHHTNLRLTRSALHSIIPVDTSLAKGIERLMPQLKNRLQCLHVRVPTINVSAMDMAINLQQATNSLEINETLRKNAQGNMKGLVGYTEEPHASVDFNTDPHSSIVDGSQTRICGGTLLKLFCWFDNEWGFANRMLDVAERWLSTT
ncbi:MAG: erythrose-4-phosphate dehydrogenase [Deltaproteobacteria bacterium]|nr:MAG: erythrose-4-phosphate dehydrogenase [Deltaproteobacteria bacterium]PIE73154.1 MAG: erythrose-4-phosphate dehydrogenase [Deltaproteobacteria bacterium]